VVGGSPNPHRPISFLTHKENTMSGKQFVPALVLALVVMAGFLAPVAYSEEPVEPTTYFAVWMKETAGAPSRLVRVYTNGTLADREVTRLKETGVRAWTEKMAPPPGGAVPAFQVFMKTKPDAPVRIVGTFASGWRAFHKMDQLKKEGNIAWIEKK
jgi:hypothetical protein